MGAAGLPRQGLGAVSHHPSQAPLRQRTLQNNCASSRILVFVLSFRILLCSHGFNPYVYANDFQINTLNLKFQLSSKWFGSFISFQQILQVRSFSENRLGTIPLPPNYLTVWGLSGPAAVAATQVRTAVPLTVEPPFLLTGGHLRNSDCSFSLMWVLSQHTFSLCLVWIDTTVFLGLIQYCFYFPSSSLRPSRMSFWKNWLDHAIRHVLNLSVAHECLQDQIQLLNLPYEDLLDPVPLCGFSSTCF